MKSLGHEMHINFPAVQHVLEKFTNFLCTSCFEHVASKGQVKHMQNSLTLLSVKNWCQELL